MLGVPTVVSDIGGLDEIIDHGENGLKSYCGNADSIADTILSLLFNHVLCNNITKKAKQIVETEYSWVKIAQDTQFTYQKAVSKTMAECQANEQIQEKVRQKSKKELPDMNLLEFKTNVYA